MLNVIPNGGPTLFPKIIIQANFNLHYLRMLLHKCYLFGLNRLEKSFLNYNTIHVVKLNHFTKLQNVTTQIVKSDWPKRWQTFLENYQFCDAGNTPVK